VILLTKVDMALQAVRDLARESDRVPQDQSRSLRWCCFWTDMACRCFVLDDSFSSPAQVIDISDIALGSSFHLAPTLVEIQPTRAQGALLNTLSLWYVNSNVHLDFFAPRRLTIPSGARPDCLFAA
jgi:hypothetical protein